jgi:hypothetical protein
MVQEPLTSTNSLGARLEADGIVVCPGRRFDLAAAEMDLLTANLSSGGVKNISLSQSGTLSGAAAGVADAKRLQSMLERFAAWSRSLLDEIAPDYGPALERGRTSFRPRPVEETQLSPRKDDRRLHVDAFASQPTGGRRILRVFSNINPNGETRLWRVGEPFEAYAKRWLGVARKPAPGEAWLLERLGITKARRTDYDALMLALHDSAKLDLAFQRDAPRHDLAFSPGDAWIVFTDQVVHAAISGRHALEQTFYLPVAAMASPESAPLRILERLSGRRLV